MFTDINISKDLMASFHQEHPDINMNVSVLTMGTWPNYKPIEVTLPRILSKQMQIFEEFYVTKFTGRKLTWQTSLSHCVLNAEFPSSKKILCTSLFQALILLLFNTREKYTYKELLEATQIGWFSSYFYFSFFIYF